MTDQIAQQASPTFRDELRSLINRHSKENGSDTPDWILATYLHDCLEAFGCAVTARERWSGREVRGPAAFTEGLRQPGDPASA